MISEWLFPLTALLLTWALLMPAATLLCALLLSWRRKRARVWADVGAPTTFMLLIAPTLGPLIWLTSATVHLIESYPVLQACMLQAEACHEALILLGLIGALTALVCAGRLFYEHAPVRIQPVSPGDPVCQRVRQLCARHELLRGLDVSVAAHCPIPVFTTGLLWRRVVLDACFVQSADDAMVIAALLHERAHVLHRDCLRHLLTKICFTLNPASRLLGGEYMHWRHALEARCDHHAITHGAEPLALAQSLVSAARFECGTSASCAPPSFGLTGQRDLSTLKLRLALLLEGGITPSSSKGHVAILLGLTACLILPHLSGSGLLDLLHIQVERLYHLP